MDFSTPIRFRSDSTAERLSNLKLEDFSLTEIDTEDVLNKTGTGIDYCNESNSSFILSLKESSIYGEEEAYFPASSTTYEATTPFFGGDDNRAGHFPTEENIFKNELSFLNDDASVKEIQPQDIDYLETLLPELPDLSTDFSSSIPDPPPSKFATPKVNTVPKTPVKSIHRFSRARKSPLAARNFRLESSLEFPDEPLTPKKKQRRKKCISKNKKCTITGCTKNARGNTGLCVKHGGGKRCKFPDCCKGARPYSDFCSKHGGGRRCIVDGCKKGALNKSDYCRRHGREIEADSVLNQTTQQSHVEIKPDLTTG